MSVRALFALPLLALMGCVAAPEPAAPPPAVEAEGPGPERVVLATTVVDGASFKVDVGLPSGGRAGTVQVTEDQHPELKGNEALARRVAGQACGEQNGAFDGSVPGLEAFGAWSFDRACG